MTVYELSVGDTKTRFDTLAEMAKAECDADQDSGLHHSRGAIEDGAARELTSDEQNDYDSLCEYLAEAN